MEAPHNVPGKTDTEIRQSLLKNSGLIVGCRVVTATTSLVAVPFMVSKLGIDGYGAWESIVAVSTLFGMFQSSIAGTLLWKMSQAHGIQDFATIRRMIRLGVFGILCLCVLVTPVIWLSAATLVQGLHIPQRLVSEAKWVLPSLVGLTVFFGLNDVMGMSIAGCQRTGTVTIIQACSLVSNYVVAIALILHGYTLEGLLIGFVVGALVSSALYFRTSQALCDGISLIPAIPTASEFKAMGSYSGLLFVGYSSSALRDQTDKIVLATFASSAWVGYYGVAARLAALVMEVARFFYTPLLTAVGAMHAADNWAGIKRIYVNMVTMVGCVAGIVTVIVAGLYDRVVMLWLGRSIPQSSVMILILLMGNAFAVILTGPGTAICRAIGKVWVETSYVVFHLVGNIILTIALVLTIGPIGTVIASGSTLALSAVAFGFVLNRVVDLPHRASTHARGFLLIMIACAGITRALASRFPQPTDRLGAFVSLLLLGSLATVLFLVLSVAARLLPISSIRNLRRRSGTA